MDWLSYLQHTRTLTHTYSPYLSSRVSSTFQYPAGSEQRFSETGYTIAPGDLQEDQLSYDPENDQQKFPVAILLETNTGDG